MIIDIPSEAGPREGDPVQFNPQRALRLACCIPYPEDGTSYHRGLGPLNFMRKQMPRLELVMPRRVERQWQMTWDWLMGCDLIFLQRPASLAFLNVAKTTKALGLPLWVEWDDDYTCIPVSNHCFADYEPNQTKKILKEIAWLANVISVATPELARRVPKPYQDKVWVIPNAAMPVFQADRDPGPNGGWWQTPPWFDHKPEKRIAWRGTDTHDEDLATILPALAELAQSDGGKEWFWHFSGGMPWQVHEAVPKDRLEQSPWCGPVMFVPMLALFKPYVLLAPLKENAFNLCKSNLAWLEATAAGAVVVAPNLEEWRRPGIINYNNGQDFKDKLQRLMAEYDGSTHPNVEISRQYIEHNLLLEKVNRYRWGILSTLLG